MSVQSHFHSLQLKKAELENLIAAESSRPLPDFLAITGLKKKKLAIKQEIEKFARETPRAKPSAS